MVKGKCNCGKKATTEWLITDRKKKVAWTMKYCDKHRPREPYNLKSMQLIDGKV
jgi:hypothetical protein